MRCMLVQRMLIRSSYLFPSEILVSMEQEVQPFGKVVEAKTDLSVSIVSSGDAGGVSYSRVVECQIVIACVTMTRCDSTDYMVT